MILSCYLRIPTRHRACIWEPNNWDSIIDSLSTASQISSVVTKKKVNILIIRFSERSQIASVVTGKKKRRVNFCDDSSKLNICITLYLNSIVHFNEFAETRCPQNWGSKNITETIIQWNYHCKENTKPVEANRFARALLTSDLFRKNNPCISVNN